MSDTAQALRRLTKHEVIEMRASGYAWEAHEGNAARYRVLVPLDGSELSAQALPVAEQLCTQLAAELELVRVLPNAALPIEASGAYVPADVYQQLAADQEHETAQYLARVAVDARVRGLRAHTHMEWGNAADTIVAAAAELDANLIVMTTHGRTGLARLALGSVADRVVRGGEAPVLLIRATPSGTQPPMPCEAELRRALVPLDGSPLAASVLYTVALVLAGPVLHEITLLQVVEPHDGLAGKRAAEEYLDAERVRLLERLAGRHCSVDRQVCISKDPAQSIVERSEEMCDLVLMATHGETGIGRLAFGGVTDRVLRDGKTPLLVVHPPRATRQ
jgi:nucleotide-binding universal stress UspA family protein